MTVERSAPVRVTDTPVKEAPRVERGREQAPAREAAAPRDDRARSTSAPTQQPATRERSDRQSGGSRSR
ncbi:MAG: hypothetical protein IPP94_00785 [Ignavibacteria bacterium]|nr:hypothetical protein [Ignavibacteria bacterium]